MTDEGIGSRGAFLRFVEAHIADEDTAGVAVFSHVISRRHSLAAPAQSRMDVAHVFSPDG